MKQDININQAMKLVYEEGFKEGRKEGIAAAGKILASAQPKIKILRGTSRCEAVVNGEYQCCLMKGHVGSHREPPKLPNYSNPMACPPPAEDAPRREPGYKTAPWKPLWIKE